jgi:hypothetical protein
MVDMHRLAMLIAVHAALLAGGSSALFSEPAWADIVYSYQSNVANPLYNAALPSGQSPEDSITISFTLQAPLVADSTYDISVATSPIYISSWAASDQLFGMKLFGTDTPISLVPSPGLMAGGALNACGNTCFGGAIETGASGNIIQWNLVADGASDSPYLTFISYDNSYIGSTDGLGSTPDSGQELELNAPNGPTGVWTETSSSPIPEPGSWTMLLTGLACIAFRIRYQRRARE